MLANSSSAVSLFFVGGVLVGLPVRGLIGQVSAVAAGKLLLHPLAVWGLLSLLTLAGPMAVTQQHAALLLAGAPMLSIYPILGQRFGSQQANAACLMGATAGAFVTLSVLIWVLGLGAA